MRFRTDGVHYADLKAAGRTLEDYCAPQAPTEEERRHWDATPKAERGDVWRVFWYHGEQGKQIDDQIAGYDICCVACGRVHACTTALNCNQKIPKPWGESCQHIESRTSCWIWSGSAEQGTLTASPSLLVVQSRCPWGCGWHGFIQNGDIH